MCSPSLVPPLGVGNSKFLSFTLPSSMLDVQVQQGYFLWLMFLYVFLNAHARRERN